MSGGSLGRRRSRAGCGASERNSLSSSCAGSPQRPVCTADGWMIVLDGATSQWKRAVVSSFAIGPAARVAGGDPLDRLEVRAHRVAVELRPERARARGSSSARARGEEVERPAEDDDADVDPLAALDAAARRGRPRRRTGYRCSRAASASSTNARGSSSRPSRYSTYDAAVVAVEPLVGNGLGDVLEQRRASPAARAARPPPRSSRRTGAARARAIAGNGVRSCPGSRSRRVVEVERGAVVDQPQPAVPEQQVRVLRGAVDVRHERVEPDDVGGELGVGRRADRRAERAARRGGSRRRG